MTDRVVLIDGESVSLFSSAEALCSYVEIQSYSGDERAFTESGEELELLTKTGAEFKRMFSKRTFNLPDFQHLSYKRSNNLSGRDFALCALQQYLQSKGVDTPAKASFSKLVEVLAKNKGVTA